MRKVGTGVSTPLFPALTYTYPLNKVVVDFTAKSLQSCPTLCDPIPGILQARTLEWVAISFSLLVLPVCSLKEQEETPGSTALPTLQFSPSRGHPVVGSEEQAEHLNG